MKIQHNENIEQIWEVYFQSRSDSSRNHLMEHYLPLVKYTADRIRTNLPDKIDADDLISAGIFGLKDALDAFDPRRGVKFETYCIPRIRGSILDELRSTDWVPRLVRTRSYQINKALQILEAQHGRLPTEEELARELQITVSNLSSLSRDINVIDWDSLNEKFNNYQEENQIQEIDTREIDLIEDQHSNNPVFEAQKHELRNFLTKDLTHTEELIIILYYYRKITMKEIGEMLGLSESRISQMHSSILTHLKTQMSHNKEDSKAFDELVNKYYVSKDKQVENIYRNDLLNKSKDLWNENKQKLVETINRIIEIAINYEADSKIIQEEAKQITSSTLNYVKEKLTKTWGKNRKEEAEINEFSGENDQEGPREIEAITKKIKFTLKLIKVMVLNELGEESVKQGKQIDEYLKILEKHEVKKQKVSTKILHHKIKIESVDSRIRNIDSENIAFRQWEEKIDGDNHSFKLRL